MFKGSGLAEGSEELEGNCVFCEEDWTGALERCTSVAVPQHKCLSDQGRGSWDRLLAVRIQAVADRGYGHRSALHDHRSQPPSACADWDSHSRTVATILGDDARNPIPVGSIGFAPVRRWVHCV